VKELKRLGVSITGIQETKWFGKDIWTADGYTLLHSGRPLPNEDDPHSRNEGVGIILDKQATDAWKDAGETWEAISSRIVTARLQVTYRGRRQYGGSRWSKDKFLTVVSVYAPTARAPKTVTDKFADDLQSVLDNVPADDILLVLGDMNARVGRRESDDDTWKEVRGPHGIGHCNEAGERLLNLCAANDLTIMNTWFKKKHVHLVTWKHPATKHGHMIDFVLMRRAQRRLCTDVRVYRSACCWTDHHMVKGTMSLNITKRKKRTQRLQSHPPLAVHILHSQEARRMYQTELEQYLSEHPHNEEGSTEENWMALKDCIMSCAEKCVGRSKRKQPDWFKDAIDVLTPLLADKQEAYNRFLCTQNSETKKEFRKCQRNVKKAVDEAKEKWIRNVIRDVELNNKDGKQKWKCIRKLQLAYAGRKPIRPAKFYKQDGSMTETPEEVQKVWVEHFTKVLNVTSQHQQELVDEVPSLDEITTLDVTPSQEELINAMTKLKQGKAGGKTGILPELLIYGGPLLFNRLLQLMKDVWHTGDVVKDWKDAEIVPIPKKGDLRHCDNWRGISLLDVVGKLFGRILQDRLQVVAEKVLPESQCGFRKGRGCVDMIFVARQLIEKCREHEDSLFALFAD
jgi:hypothetical protein